MVVSVVEDKILVSISVPEAVAASGFTAGSWLSGVMEAVGGRGGGKDTSAQGQVADVTKLAAVQEAGKAIACKVFA